MINFQIPSFCQPCIVRLQATCPHLHTSFIGGQHFSGGDYWEDIAEICSDCGSDLDALDIPSQSIPDENQISNPLLLQEKTQCKEN
jgi:hypothetical protein